MGSASPANLEPGSCLLRHGEDETRPARLSLTRKRLNLGEPRAVVTSDVVRGATADEPRRASLENCCEGSGPTSWLGSIKAETPAAGEPFHLVGQVDAAHCKRLVESLLFQQSDGVADRISLIREVALEIEIPAFAWRRPA